MSKDTLEVSSLTKNFAGLVALDKVEMYLEKGEVVGLIGPNGSGKTTLFNCITGFLKPDSGKITLTGKDITSCPTSDIIQSGISRTFQIVRNFPELTVSENLLCSQCHKGEKKLKSLFTQSTNSVVNRAKELAHFVGLDRLLSEPAGELSYGQQKLLDLISALMPNPSFVLLDEPTAGVNPTLINDIVDRIQDMNRELGVGFLVIEHNVDVVLDISDRMYALGSGKVISQGNAEQVRNDPNVLEAYFGG